MLKGVRYLYQVRAISFVLNFAFAEAQEADKKLEEVHTTFETFIEVLRKDLEVVEARVNSANPSSLNGSQSQSNLVAADGGALPPGFATVGTQSQNSSLNTQSADEKQPKFKELTDRRTEYGVAWIMYMRFARRAENLKSARAIFGKARRDRWTPWEVFEAAGTTSICIILLSQTYKVVPQ